MAAVLSLLTLATLLTFSDCRGVVLTSNTVSSIKEGVPVTHFVCTVKTAAFILDWALPPIIPLGLLSVAVNSNLYDHSSTDNFTAILTSKDPFEVMLRVPPTAELDRIECHAGGEVASVKYTNPESVLLNPPKMCTDGNQVDSYGGFGKGYVLLNFNCPNATSRYAVNVQSEGDGSVNTTHIVDQPTTSVILDFGISTRNFMAFITAVDEFGRESASIMIPVKTKTNGGILAGVFLAIAALLLTVVAAIVYFIVKCLKPNTHSAGKTKPATVSQTSKETKHL